MPFSKYNLQWPDGTDPLEIEFWLLSQSDEQIKTSGTNRLDVYLRIHHLIWPQDKQHRWFVIGIKSIVENKISVFMGSASSGKTYTFAIHALIDFFCFPRNSFSLISSTEKRSLEIKVWGRVKELFNRAKDKYDWLPGFILESAMAITPEEIDEENERARELNRGLVCVPCVSGGRFVGMGKFQGAKPPHSPGKFDGILKHYGDEAAVMQPSFLDAYTNWMVSPGFKGVMGGNPTDISDPLCVAAEPEGGWDAFVDTEKTQEWNSRWYGAHVVAFDGRDNPNRDEPKNSFPFLISDEFVAATKKTHGDDSWQFFQQAVGKPSRGMVSNRVITIGLCERHKAFDPVVWKGTPRTRIYAIDPAYGGGDRCVGGELEFGEDAYGKTILVVHEPEIISIRLNSGLEPEEQIAAFVKNKSDTLGIAASNMGYDSFGRGTLGFSFAKVFGSICPVPIDAGAKPTDRPVRHDLYIEVRNQSGTVERRLKKCSEHYSKFVTEMWFSTREAIESEQIRELPLEVAREGQLRMYSIVRGNMIEVESKEDMKERIKKSPDLYDWFAIGVEMARRLGFQISRIGNVDKKEDATHKWLEEESKLYENAIKEKMLARA